MKTQKHRINDDKPLSDPAADRLGYALLGKQIAEIISAMVPTQPEGVVMALNGQWGSGKTTVVNYIRNYLKLKDYSDTPDILDFNPWWFSAREDLAKNFLNKLAIHVGNDSREKRAVGRLVKKFASAVTDLQFEVAGVKLKASELAKLVGEYMEEEGDVPKFKREISELMRTFDRPILVVIDDIDRLPSDDIVHLFCVIKALADFPNMMYLLVFDRAIVQSAITKLQNIKGESYIDKIVQIPFTLPLPDAQGLRDILIQELANIFDSTDKDLIDADYFGEIIEHISNFIDTPRDVARLCNAIACTYPAVHNEVNPADFVGLEALRIFCPEVYDVIRSDLAQFTGVPNVDKKDALQKFHEQWLSKLDDSYKQYQIPLKMLLAEMFPKLALIWRNIQCGPEMAGNWIGSSRVCSPEKATTFFYYGVIGGSISNKELQTIYAIAPNPEELGEILIQYSKQITPSGRTRVRQLLDRIGQEAFVIPEVLISPILHTLCEVGDNLWCKEDEPINYLDFGNPVRVVIICLRFIKRLEPDKAEIELKSAMSNGSALATIGYVQTCLEEEHDPNKNRKGTMPHLPIEKVKALGIVVAKRLREGLAKNTLKPKETRRLIESLASLDSGSIKQSIEELAKTPSKLVLLIEDFSFVNSLRDGKLEFDALNFSNYADPGVLKGSVEKLLNAGVPPDQQKILKAYLDGLKVYMDQNARFSGR